MALSKSPIDRLGERLKIGEPSEDDLRLLDEYRLSFAGACETVVAAIRAVFDLPITARPAKTTKSTIEKLRRESIRLSQIQDIAGCRVLVDDVTSQNAVAEHLMALHGETEVVDRRIQPSHGYRALHLIARWAVQPVEIQVRTALQQVWAELSEKLSEAVDASIKYGGGDERTRRMLQHSSQVIEALEELELGAAVLPDENPKKTAMLAEIRGLRDT
jgi:ppGpp synthetase/RelA/SpoT-type nucleotidyltranferase